MYQVVVICPIAGGSPPEGIIHPPFPSCNISVQEMVFSGTESLDFQAKKWGNQPQDFLSISFLLDRPDTKIVEKWVPDGL